MDETWPKWLDWNHWFGTSTAPVERTIIWLASQLTVQFILLKYSFRIIRHDNHSQFYEIHRQLHLNYPLPVNLDRKDESIKSKQCVGGRQFRRRVSSFQCWWGWYIDLNVSSRPCPGHCYQPYTTISSYHQCMVLSMDTEDSFEIERNSICLNQTHQQYLPW